MFGSTYWWRKFTGVSCHVWVQYNEVYVNCKYLYKGIVNPGCENVNPGCENV
jgi:hypothetical protein